MRPLPILATIAGLAAASLSASGADPSTVMRFADVPWGAIDPLPEATGTTRFLVSLPPPSGRLSVPDGFPQIVSAGVPRADSSGDLVVEVDPATGAVTLVLADGATGPVMVATADSTRQFEDGRICLTARDARVEGAAARLASRPGHHRVGVPEDPAARVAWVFPATRWGRYDVLVAYASAARGDVGIEVVVGSVALPGNLAGTGGEERYTTARLGRVTVGAAGPLPVQVRRVMATTPVHLKAVSLVPACEGNPPLEGEDGAVLLHAGDATVRGTMLRWEPADNKRTLGYWTQRTDAAEWDFSVSRPGAFAVEVLQGCGPGQGGSVMDVWVDRGAVDEQLVTFTVEETGGFQEFRSRSIGTVRVTRVGSHRLHVQPRSIARAAACDIRHIKLVPESR